MTSPVYFRQLLAGRDFALKDSTAAGMANFVYLIGDAESRECVVVDPAWCVSDLLRVVASDDMTLVGALATHYHPDHVGGDLMGLATVEGIRELLDAQGLKVHCHRNEAPWIRECTGVSATDMALHDSGEVLTVGKIPIQFIHTPGHTPGSECYLVENRLVAGDTLFLQGCGRTDLPGGDSDEMYKTLHQRLAHLPDDTLLYPGHLYGPEGSSTLGNTRATNQVFRVRGLDDWQRFFGN